MDITIIERFVLTLANVIATDVSLWSTGPLEWHAAVPDAGIVGGPYPSRDRAMSAAQLAAEQHYGSRVVRCEPKDRVDEIAALRARVTALEETLALRSRTLVDVNEQLVATMDRAEAATERVEELEAIVREIAAMNPVTTSIWPDREEHHCEICGNDSLSGQKREQFEHPADCPWLMARKAMGMETG